MTRRNIARGMLIALISGLPAWADRPEVPIPIAITSVHIQPAAGAAPIQRGTILLRDGRIEAVGANVAIPPDARVIDGSGLFAYPGFIDALDRIALRPEAASEADERADEGEFADYSETPQIESAPANRKGIHAARRVEEWVDLTAEAFNDVRASGFTAALLAPPQALLSGTASVLSLGDRPLRDSVCRSGVALSGSFSGMGSRLLRSRGNYPATVLGAVAHLRQFLLDGQWFSQAQAYVQRHPSAAGDLPFDQQLDAVQPLLAGKLPLVWEADGIDEIDRALRLADEFKLSIWLAGASEADRVADELKRRNVPVILTLKAPAEVREYQLDARALSEPESDPTRFGDAWNERPFHPRRAHEEAQAWRSGRLAVAQKLEQAGVAWCFSALDLRRGTAALEAVTTRIEAGLSDQAALRALTATPARLLGLERELGSLEVGKRAHVTLLNARLGEKKNSVNRVIIDGREFPIELDPKATRSGRGRDRRGAGRAARTASEAESRESEEVEDEEPQESQPASQPSASQPTTSSQAAGPADSVRTHAPDWPIETPADRIPSFRTGGRVLLRNALVLTISGDDLPDTDVLIEDGRITRIGPKLTAPADAATVDLTGYVVLPGIIDPHSHIAAWGVNEATSSVVPEVRMADVIRQDDENIFQALAGGCTTIHLMHGSANTIGGQCVVLKLKYGRRAGEMLVPDVAPTVKFALGENVKRPGMVSDRWDREMPRRFPGTRMGVEAVIRRAFDAGRAYAAQRDAYQRDGSAGKDPFPLRRDLRLEALADILSGKIRIQCHCYRADEILRLLETTAEYGVRVAGLHHCLEAYRVIPEIASHGCGTATFADWWAYKIEAYDAVPHNAGMLLRGGVNSTIKSDSGELMRHMNLEAAKCVKYSGLTPNEALRLITLNPARLFGLEKQLGSIEVGKAADIAVFDGHPLDSYSRCVMTLVDGEAYFVHRDFDPQSPPRPRRAVMRFEEPIAPAPRAADGPSKRADTPKEFQAAQAQAAAAGGPDAVPLAMRMADLLEKGVWCPPATALNPAGRYAIVDATLHPVSRPPLERATLLIENGRISAVGQVFQIPQDATVLNGAGLHVYPGLINAATTLGLYEIGQVEVTVDTSESGTYQPDLHALSAFNPLSALIEVTRAEGVTTALIIPQRPTLAGQAGLVDLDGWTMPEMRIDPAVGLVLSLPSPRAQGMLKEDDPEQPAERPRGRRRGPSAEDADQALAEVSRLFADAQVYARQRRHAQQSGTPFTLKQDARLDALSPYALAEKPVLFEAGTYKRILEALQFAERFDLKPIILGGAEAWKLADLLAARGTPVIFEGTTRMPSGVPYPPNSSDRWDAQYLALSRLEAAGVKYCLSHQGADLAKLLPFEAGIAVAHGLAPEAALRAMTLSAAEILGIADNYGSLDVGKVANVFIATGDPCQATTRVLHVFIRGKPVSLQSKHTRDAAQFADRPRAP